MSLHGYVRVVWAAVFSIQRTARTCGCEQGLRLGAAHLHTSCQHGCMCCVLTLCSDSKMIFCMTHASPIDQQNAHSPRHCREAWFSHVTVMSMCINRYGVQTMLHPDAVDGSTVTFLQSLAWFGLVSAWHSVFLVAGKAPQPCTT